MRRNVFCTMLLAAAVCGMSYAEEKTKPEIDVEKTPWLKGVELPAKLQGVSPTIPMKITLDNGQPIPATLTEDIPISVVADTGIYDSKPPKTEEAPGAEWVAKEPVAQWWFDDWEINKSTPAAAKAGAAPNAREITPLNPTGNGTVTCFVSRRMSYISPEGKTKKCFANSSCAANTRVLDITPPCCGFDISTKSGKAGSCWPIENPPNQYPLPKHADVLFSGSLFGAKGKDMITATGLELGENMIIDEKVAALNITGRDVLTIKVIGDDNYKLDSSKVKFGISAGPNTPTIVPENTEVIEVAKLKMPKKPYLYLEAADTTGNKQRMYIPIKLRRR